MTGLLRDFGLDDYYFELSTRDDSKPDKFIGSNDQWETATSVLETAARKFGVDLVPDPGGAAFYGPKISVQAKDAIGRTWQMSTIQYDFNQPAVDRFNLEYVAADGTRQQPVMIHSAKFGSIERFIGVLVEHYAGAFPPWLAPVQVQGIPIAERHNDYLFDIAKQMKAQGLRVEVDESDDRMQKKIRNAQLAEGALHDDRRRRRRGGGRRVVPLPRRPPGQRGAAGRGHRAGGRRGRLARAGLTSRGSGGGRPRPALRAA